jgi:hypothetical protein
VLFIGGVQSVHIKANLFGSPLITVAGFRSNELLNCAITRLPQSGESLLEVPVRSSSFL